MYSYKTECPHCGGNNYSITPDKGLAHCFNCGYAQRFGDAPIVDSKVRGPVGEIRDYYAQMTKYYHACVDSRARGYLHSRGITDKLIDQYQLGYCPKDTGFVYSTPIAKESGLLNDYGTPTLYDRIVFPYFYKGTVYDLRGRSIDPRSEIRYKSPHGARYYRGADYPYLADNQAYTHVLTEGEIKAIIITSIGIRAVAFPGITINYEAYRPNKYMICLDGEKDLSKRLTVRQAIHRLSTCGFDPYVMTLPLKDKEKMGADDLILGYGENVFRQYYSMAIAYETWKRIIR